jgi:ATP/maltotriose-dependent transcriptional regulator MalT
LLEKRQQVPQEQPIDADYFIYCLEAVQDIETDVVTEAQKSLEQLTVQYGVASIYKTCDTIEGLEDSLNALVLDDHHFIDYEVIYLVIKGEANSICLNDYYYSLQEIAEIFEGRLQGKILHFSNAKVLDLDKEEAQYFLDITGAKGISGYGNECNGITSSNLDKAYFNLFKEDDNMLAVVEELHQRHYTACRLLDFRMYY